jgi:hypothetical protein
VTRKIWQPGCETKIYLDGCAHTGKAAYKHAFAIQMFDIDQEQIFEIMQSLKQEKNHKFFL